MDNETTRPPDPTRLENTADASSAVACESAERIKALEALVAQLRAGNASAQKQSKRVSDLEVQLRLAEKRVAAAEELAARAHQHIAAMHRSNSWRLTSPIRAGGLAVRKVAGSKAIGREVAKRAVLHGAAFVRNRPALRENIAQLLARFPGIRARMIQLAGYNAIQGFAAGAAPPAVDTVDRLTARGRQVHADLIIARNASAQ